MKKLLLAATFCSILLGSCHYRDYPTEIEGYAPIYMEESDQYNISIAEAQAYENPGKIYKYGNYTFQMDKGKGIHVINSTNPAIPQKIKFIKVPGCTDISIKGTMLYANNFRDLVTLNIADIYNNKVSVSHRNKNVFPASLDGTPPEENIYFECVDNSKGIVVGWEKKTLQHPKCYR